MANASHPQAHGSASDPGRARLAAEQKPVHEHLLKAALHSFMRIFGARMGNIQILDLTGTHADLSIIAHEGFREPFLSAFAHVSADQGTACGRALQRAEAVVVEDVETDVEFEPFRAIAREAGFRSVLSMPLKTSWGHNVGIISVHFPHPGRPSVEQISRGEIHARQIAHDVLQTVESSAP